MPDYILLVDDDRDDREFFCDAVCKVSNVSCVALQDGRLLFEQLSNKEIGMPGLIFFDVNMPQMDGWECLALLKQSEDYKEIPVIIYSTNGHEEEISKAKALGAKYFFTKPRDFAVLKQVLSDAIIHLQENKLDMLAANSKLFV